MNTFESGLQFEIATTLQKRYNCNCPKWDTVSFGTHLRWVNSYFTGYRLFVYLLSWGDSTSCWQMPRLEHFQHRVNTSIQVGSKMCFSFNFVLSNNNSSGASPTSSPRYPVNKSICLREGFFVVSVYCGYHRTRTCDAESIHCYRNWASCTISIKAEHSTATRSLTQGSLHHILLLQSVSHRDVLK